MKKYMCLHKNCPYFDKDKRQCFRTGCIFLIPCLAMNEAKGVVAFKKITVKVNKERRI